VKGGGVLLVDKWPAAEQQDRYGHSLVGFGKAPFCEVKGKVRIRDGTKVEQVNVLADRGCTGASEGRILFLFFLFFSQQ
jgi:hypothetical protein